jgi:hypothetical protein
MLTTNAATAKRHAWVNLVFFVLGERGSSGGEKKVNSKNETTIVNIRTGISKLGPKVLFVGRLTESTPGQTGSPCIVNLRTRGKL